MERGGVLEQLGHRRLLRRGVMAVLAVTVAVDGTLLAVHSSDGPEALRFRPRTGFVMNEALTLPAKQAPSVDLPPLAYQAVIGGSKGNIALANERLQLVGAPPLTPRLAEQLAGAGMVRFSDAQVIQIEHLWRHWYNSPAVKRPVHLKPHASAELLAGYSAEQQAAIRARIIKIAMHEYSMNVHEYPGIENRGLRVDDYNMYRINHLAMEWCANFVSTVYHLSDMPLSGGKQYAPHNPDMLIWRAAEPANPHESPRLPSVSDWFKKYGYYFLNGQHEPQPGDVFFSWHWHINKDTGIATQEWHTGLVLGVDHGILRTMEGNVADALRTESYPDYSHNQFITGFGSFFPPRH